MQAEVTAAERERQRLVQQREAACTAVILPQHTWQEAQTAARRHARVQRLHGVGGLMQEPPRFWRCFTGYFGLDEAAARRWWQAVCVAQGPHAVAWHRAMRACDAVESPSPEAVRAFLIVRIPPAQVIDLIEALVRKGSCHAVAPRPWKSRCSRGSWQMAPGSSSERKEQVCEQRHYPRKPRRGSNRRPPDGLVCVVPEGDDRVTAHRAAREKITARVLADLATEQACQAAAQANASMGQPAASVSQ